MGPNLASTIHSSIKPDAFLPANHSSSLFLSPVDSVQVELVLSGRDRHKATIDIPNYLFKIASNLLPLPSQTYVMNQLNQVLSRIFSRSQRLSQKDWCSDRPWQLPSIAVLSPFAKILERPVQSAKSFPRTGKHSI